MTRDPWAFAWRSSSVRSRRPMPIPRADCATHMHSNSVGAPSWLIRRFEERARELVAAPVEQLPLGKPGPREPNRADTPVLLGRLDGDEPRRLERAKEAAEVARVEGEPRAEPPDVGAIDPDLPQQASLAERAVAGEVAVVERADALGDEAVEAAHLADRRSAHSLILVRELRLQRRVRQSAARSRPGYSG